MKIRFEIELSESELPAAQEFINAIKTIATSVQMRVQKPVVDVSVVQLLQAAKAPNKGEITQQHWEEAADEFSRLVQTKGKVKGDALVKEFVEAFNTVVFGQSGTGQGDSAAPYLFAFMSRLTDQFRVRIRNAFLQNILRVLTAPRPVDCRRADFFAYAEAFAALVKLELMDIDAAILTINKMLQHEETRCASITMLGKTVEFCLDLISTRCDPRGLDDLHATLNGLRREPAFEYDVKYITENLNWT